MSVEANRHCANFGKVVAYTVYNLGVCIVVGLVRTMIAVAYIARHAFVAHTYAEAQKQQSNKAKEALVGKQVASNRAVKEAEKATENAAGLNKAGAWLKEKATQAQHSVVGVIDDIEYQASKVAQGVRVTVVQGTCETRQEAWYGELVRGLSEMLIVGAPYYTYQDNFSKDHQVSIFGLQELAKLIQDEANADDVMKQVLGEAYNPWF